MRSFIIVCGCLLCILVGVADAESMMQAFGKFQKFRLKKIPLFSPSLLKSVECERSGHNPKSLFCYNKHGARCDPGYLRETQSCSATGRCTTNGDIAKTSCPQPCGCTLEGQPKRESDGKMRLETIHVSSSCSSGETRKKIQQLLSRWKVPSQAHGDYESGALRDRASFVVFDHFIQPDLTEARYGLSLGAIRCHAKKIEIGYMYTGMWKVDTVSHYSCDAFRGCKDIGIAYESVQKVRSVLQYYAWKNLKIDSHRRLVTVSDHQLEAGEAEANFAFGNGGVSFDEVFDDGGTLYDYTEDKSARLRRTARLMKKLQRSEEEARKPDLPACPFKYCLDYRHGSCGFGWSNPFGSTCGYCISCSKPGYASSKKYLGY